MHVTSFTTVGILYIKSRPGQDVHPYVIKFVSDLRQFGCFLKSPPVSLTNKTDPQNKTEILLKVALNTIKHTNNI